jgi:hypothetical protein
VIHQQQQQAGAHQTADVLHTFPICLAQTTPTGTLLYSNTNSTQEETFPRTTEPNPYVTPTIKNKHKTHITVHCLSFFPLTLFQLLVTQYNGHSLTKAAIDSPQHQQCRKTHKTANGPL